ncbi:DUF4097 family beta strand repeat-containing protein [Sporosarcina sp. ACRSM]|uniref:DUF4097 family beta strand repeat-containing protein n=1 Tax=Sporosarcina sp. ACRSM TaxID=2918216 RepID=UPI001EF3F856|nr:DUF4097 family beta strand repeat-containing protein [Sporosarcina sp. ACRSM]MCG7337502.1 DUF4097 family beta strand repeat-containing protein [Sporosarcina sp. ACRSM]
MQNERKRILAMLENGTITTDEALTLLEALSQTKGSEKKVETEQTSPTAIVKQEEPASEQRSGEQTDEKNTRDEQKNPSIDEFLEDLRKDFTNVGDRFMHFMQTAVQKVKSFDFDSPFGNAVTFQQIMTKPASGIEEVIIDIDNGKVTLHHEETEEVRAEFAVKTFNSDSEEKAKKDFLDKLLFAKDEEKLLISSDLKMVQVNVDLYLPKKDYAKISARLLNGAFKMKDATAETIRVKTANGKIDVTGLTFKNGEFETANGAISLNGITGTTLEAETLNGRVYIDGVVKDVEAQSLNGHVVVTTKDPEAEKIDAKTMSGSVEIYIPSDVVALSGEISSNMGRLDLQLDDVNRTAEQEQFLQKSIRFKKDIEGNVSPLHIFGETKTGSVLVCYNAKHD